MTPANDPFKNLFAPIVIGGAGVNYIAQNEDDPEQDYKTKGQQLINLRQKQNAQKSHTSSNIVYDNYLPDKNPNHLESKTLGLKPMYLGKKTRRVCPNSSFLDESVFLGPHGTSLLGDPTVPGQT